MRILIIEDQPDIAANIGDFLEIHNHLVDFADNGELGLNLAAQDNFDLVILDINLPKMDGFSMCQKLRNDYKVETPVLMLTARSSLADKITGFNAGAWDYLVKPFALEELLLRINALSLRKQANQPKVIELDALKLDLNNWQVTREQIIIPMHKACMQILEMLMRSSPQIVNRRDLEFLLWGDSPPDSNPLRTHMHELRSKLDKPFEFAMLKTIRGIGYQLITQRESNEP
jgi:DNA-binding response OmpR family regulator